VGIDLDVDSVAHSTANLHSSQLNLRAILDSTYHASTRLSWSDKCIIASSFSLSRSMLCLLQ